MSGITFPQVDKPDQSYHPVQPENEIDTLKDRLQAKVRKIKFIPSQEVNWDTTRIVTPGQIIGYESEEGLKIISFSKEDGVQLFRLEEESQGLFREGKQVVAGSVTSKSKTGTKRSDEKKGTYIQYDKERVDQDKKDFQVESVNYRKSVNYDGGHIIDHKFSAQGSHTTEENYFPQHFFYNQKIKEYLVKPSRCDNFVEIPLYTPNPPLIGVQKKEHSHPIPIAIILIQIKDKKICNVYCFPNAIDYKGLRDKIAKNPVATLASYFCLDSGLHVLLRPAIITASTQNEKGFSKQTKREYKFMELIDDITYGMSLSECSDVQQLISELSYSVLHEEDVDPLQFISEEQYDKVKNEPLVPAFNSLGSFLVKYGIKNALKTEALSINSRLIFCNVIIDFMECYHQVSENAMDFVTTLGDDFHDTLDELAEITSMNEQESLFFINTLLRLASPHLQSFIPEERDELYDEDSMREFFQKTMEFLGSYVSKCVPEEFTENTASNIIGITSEINFIMEFVQDEFLEDQLEQYYQILKRLAEISQELLAKQEQKDSVYYFEYQTTPTRGSQSKMSVSYLKHQLQTLVDS